MKKILGIGIACIALTLATFAGCNATKPATITTEKPKVQPLRINTAAQECHVGAIPFALEQMIESPDKLACGGERNSDEKKDKMSTSEILAHAKLLKEDLSESAPLPAEVILSDDFLATEQRSEVLSSSVVRHRPIANIPEATPVVVKNDPIPATIVPATILRDRSVDRNAFTSEKMLARLDVPQRRPAVKIKAAAPARPIKSSISAKATPSKPVLTAAPLPEIDGPELEMDTFLFDIELPSPSAEVMISATEPKENDANPQVIVPETNVLELSAPEIGMLDRNSMYGRDVPGIF